MMDDKRLMLPLQGLSGASGDSLLHQGCGSDHSRNAVGC